MPEPQNGDRNGGQSSELEQKLHQSISQQRHRQEPVISDLMQCRK
jgi:hypothetical protein